MPKKTTEGKRKTNFQIVSEINKYKYCTFQIKTRSQEWFKRKVIDDQNIHKQLEGTDFDLKQFCERIEELFACKNLPKFALKSKKSKHVFFSEGFKVYMQIFHKNAPASLIQSKFGGVGIKLKNEKSVAVKKLPINGTLHILVDSVWQKLKEKEHNSLFQIGPTRKGILMEALSFANHDCTSTYEFTILQKTENISNNNIQKKKIKC
jgi:hypothetical protein